MVKIVKQNFGSQLLIDIRADNLEELNETFYSFYNHGATSSDVEPDYFGGLFHATFWTTPYKLSKYLLNSSYHIIMNRCGDQPDKNFQNDVENLANRRKLEIIDEKIIEYAKDQTTAVEFTTTQEIPIGLQEAE